MLSSLHLSTGFKQRESYEKKENATLRRRPSGSVSESAVVNVELAPAIAAAAGGSALIGVIALHEGRQDKTMRESRVRLALRFPAGLEPSAAIAALGGLSGLPSSVELVFELSASEAGIEHALWVPDAARSSVESVMGGAISGLRLTETTTEASAEATLSRRLTVPVPVILSTGDPTSASRVLLTGLSRLRAGERVLLRFALRPAPAPSLAEADKPDARRREVERAWRRKTASPGIRVSGGVLVAASKPSRAVELAEPVESVLRSRRGLGGGIRSTSLRGSRALSWMPRTNRRSGWLSGGELLALLAWPLGAEVVAGVTVGVSRQLPAPRSLPSRGRVLFVGRDAYGERLVALSNEAAKHHLLIAGSSGVGKSTFIGGGVLSDISRGDSAGVVIDPKADLVQDILARVPAEHADRIVVLDPGDRRPLPGLVLLSGGGDPDLRAEALTGALRSIFSDVWGVRSDFYVRLAVRSLAEVPGATLADIGRLFFEERFRRQVLGRVSDPFIVSAWQSYEALSEAAKAEQVAAPMNRVMSLLTRPRVRAVLASPRPTLDVGRLMRERKWLLVSLAPGQIGEASASLIGAVVMYAAWAAIEARVVLPPQRRAPVYLYVDELATLTGGVPFSFELLAERARGLGAGLTVAVQTLGRVPEPTRSALLGNVGSFISFRASAEEAPRIARQLPGLSERDLMGLGRFEVAARVGTGIGSTVSVVTGRTLPLPPTTGMAETIRERSAARYGAEAEESKLETTLSTPAAESEGGLGVARRRS